MRAATVSATLIPNRFAWNPVLKTESSLDLISTQTPMAFTIRFVNYLFFFKTYIHTTSGESQKKRSINEAKAFSAFSFSRS
jgi:hypothetical protein